MQLRRIVFAKELVINRRGLLFVGAFRETLFLSGLLAVVLMVLMEVKHFSKGHWSAPETDPAKPPISILGFDLDEDRQTVVVYAFPETVAEFSVEDGTMLSRDRHSGLAGVASSSHHSTVVYHTQWTENGEVWSSVSITKDGDAVLTDEFEGEHYYPADIFVSSDGRTASMISHSGTCLGWQFTDAGVERWKAQLPHAATSNSMSPDGRTCLAIYTSGVASICDLKTGQQLVALSDLPNIGRSIAWTDDSKKVAIASRSGSLRVFDTGTGQQLWEKQFDAFNQRRLVFTRDGNRLAVAGLESEIRIWNLEDSSAEETVLLGSSSFVVDMLVTPHQSTLISASIDGTIREWSLEKNELIRQIR